MDDNIIYEEKTTTIGRISFGKTNLKENIEKVSTGERRDGKEIVSAGLSITVFGKPDNQGKREVLYSGPEIFYRG